MKKLFIVALAALFVATVAASAMAITWAPVAKSAFKNTDVVGSQDWRRIKLYSMVADADGNIYATANNGQNAWYNYPDYNRPYVNPPNPAPEFNDGNGGVTIFKADGGKIDIKPSDFSDPGWASYQWGPEFTMPPFSGRTDSKLVGSITKLVVAGDGKVYGLMNWMEIHWDHQWQNQRIVRINPDGTMDPIWSPGPAKNYLWSSGVTYKPQDTQAKIRGLTVGGDGDIYWTMNGGDNYWKWHFLWKYDVAAGTVIENPYNSVPDAGGSPISWGQTMRMFNIEYVGNDRFAILANGHQWEGAWFADCITWNGPRYGAQNGQSKPGLDRDRFTATAYDPQRKLLWVAGRSNGSGPYIYNGEGPVNKLDLGSGNIGLQFVKSAGKRLFYARNDVQDADKELTLAARFRVENYSADYNGALFALMPKEGASGVSPQGIVKIRHDAVNGDKFILVDTYGTEIGTIAPVVKNQWNEVYLYANSNTGMLSCWWNGVPVSFAQPTWNSMNARVYLGAGSSAAGGYTYGSDAGSMTATFDWINFAKARVEPGEPWPLDVLAAVVDGSLYPDLYARSCTMSRWSGDVDPSNPNPNQVGLFTVSETEPYVSLPVRNYEDSGETIPHPYNPNADEWPANGNAPAASFIPNGGDYWVTALAIDPGTGYCWYSIGAEAGYNHDSRGHVFARGVNKWELYDLGEIEPNSEVVALTFHGGEVHALVHSFTTGDFTLYSAVPPPAPLVFKSIQNMKKSSMGVMYGFDAPKVVTKSDPYAQDPYFYVQEVDPASGVGVAGIKVVPGNFSIPIPSVGDLVGLSGYLEVANGEAQLRTFGIETVGTGDSPTPLNMIVKNLGGKIAGIQPAVHPANGPSNIGLLVSTAGKVAAVVFDDESGLPFFTIDDGSGAETTYRSAGGLATVPGVKVAAGFFSYMLTTDNFVSVVGVSAVDNVKMSVIPTVPTFKQRVILTRTDTDIQILQ